MGRLLDAYYTVVLPYTREHGKEWTPREGWGPFAVIGRGAFSTRREAHEWAWSHLRDGAPYSLRLTPAFEEV